MGKRDEGAKLADQVSQASLRVDATEQSAKAGGGSLKGVQARQSELADSAATAADQLK